MFEDEFEDFDEEDYPELVQDFLYMLLSFVEEGENVEYWLDLPDSLRELCVENALAFAYSFAVLDYAEEASIWLVLSQALSVGHSELEHRTIKESISCYKSLRLYEQAGIIAREAFDDAKVFAGPSEQGEFALEIAIIKEAEEDYETSESWLLKAKDYFQQAEDPKNEAFCWYNLASVRLDLKKRQGAKIALNKFFACFPNHKEPIYRMAQLQLANWLDIYGKPEEALDLYLEVVDSFTAYPQIQKQIEVWDRIAWLAGSLGKGSLRGRALARSFHYRGQFNYAVAQANLAFAKSKSCLETEFLDEAQDFCLQALSLYQSVGLYHLEIEARVFLFRLHSLEDEAGFFYDYIYGELEDLVPLEQAPAPFLYRCWGNDGAKTSKAPEFRVDLSRVLGLSWNLSQLLEHGKLGTTERLSAMRDLYDIQDAAARLSVDEENLFD